MSIGCITFASLILLLITISRKPCLRPRWSSVDLRSARELLDSGSSFFLIQVAAVIVFSSDNIVVSHYLGASEVTPYSVAWRVAGLAAMSAVSDLSGAVARVRGGLCQPGLPVDTADLRRNDEGNSRLECCLRFGAGLLRPHVHPAVGRSRGGASHPPDPGDGALDHCERFYERRIMLTGGAQSDAWSGDSIDLCSHCECCPIRGFGAAHRGIGRDRRAQSCRMWPCL